MASRKYTNADLARFERRPLGITLESPSASASAGAYEEPTGPSVDDLLRNAKGSLGRATQLRRGLDQEMAAIDQGQADERQALDWSSAEPSLMDSTSTSALKSLKHYIATRPEVLDIAALPLSVVPNPLQGAAAIWQGARGGQRMAEGGMERVQEHPILTGMDALMAMGGAGAALKGLRGLAGAPRSTALTPELLPPGSMPRGLLGPTSSSALGPKSTQALDGLPNRPQLLERNPVSGPFESGPSGLPTPKPLPSGPTPAGYLNAGRPELQLGPAPTQLPPSSLSGLRNAGQVPTPHELGLADSGSFWSGAGLPVRPSELNAELAIPYNDAAPFKVLASKASNVASKARKVAPKAAKSPANKHAIDFEAAMAGEGPALDVLGESSVNASGDSSASLEALQRMAGMKAKGQSFAVRKGGKLRKLTGPDAVDYRVQPGEEYGVVGPQGEFAVRDAAERLVRTPAFAKLRRSQALGTSR